MDRTKIVIPFDFPFAILENRNEKRVYAVADGQYTYGPLSLFQYHNDEKYSTIPESDELPSALPCKEYYIVESDNDLENTIELMDDKRGRIYVKEMNHEVQQEINQRQTRQSTILSKTRSSPMTRSNLNTSPPSLRSQSATNNRILINVKSSGYGQQSLAYATPKRTVRK